ncbi:hypothetical protein ACA910_021696 [Epithemia clementina (nom. ined.)]
MQRPDGDEGEECLLNQGKAPSLVRPVPRYAEDVRALKELMNASHPPKVLVRPRCKSLVALMFGDASGVGFGTSLWLQGTTSIQAEHGIWTRMYSRQSFNFCKFYNVVLRMETLVSEGTIKTGTEVFIFMDNSTTESAFYQGTSSQGFFLTWCFDLGS